MSKAEKSETQSIVGVKNAEDHTRSIKIVKLIIKNYRGIGPNGLEIEIDNIVILVGPNNSGKSTILKAFALVTTEDTKIEVDDFHCKRADSKPEIEVWSKVLDPKIHSVVNKRFWVDSEGMIKEKWTWSSPGTKALRVGFRVDQNKWASASDEPKAPFSNDGAAAAYRPLPTYVSPFEQPEVQVSKIKKFIAEEVYASIKETKKDNPDYARLVKNLHTLQEEIRSDAIVEEKKITTDLEKILGGLFVGTTVNLEISPKTIDILASYASEKDIDFKIDDFALENQGSGMQRALLWSVLKMLADREKPGLRKTKKRAELPPESNESQKKRTQILLMDEPEICLHPESIRRARETLYSLAEDGNWQIMITTHSPIFIDLSKDNTNIIRVQKDETVANFFKTNEAGLSSDEKEQLKMLNIFDPYFAEFFFAKNVIVVEGDTEYTAFRKIIDSDKEKYQDIHIIRARGKYTILPIIKILNKWGKKFSILHDSDLPDDKTSWPANEKILNLVCAGRKIDVEIRLLACKKNFEKAFFDDGTVKDKPFNAYKKIDDTGIKKKITNIFDYLCNKKDELDGDDRKFVCAYGSIEELSDFVGRQND